MRLSCFPVTERGARLLSHMLFLRPWERSFHIWNR